jgi:hypothetical protein
VDSAGLGIFGDQAPDRLRAFRTAGQLTPEELVDRYQLHCRPVRDLLVVYLRERQPAMDCDLHLALLEIQETRPLEHGPGCVMLPRRECAAPVGTPQPVAKRRGLSRAAQV